ncbi:MAG: hypothetical protein IJM84_02490, partial [Bacteroidaceae bacterium]|nr:hypothetical protein [Bacteroidaceae bacterium]
RTRRIDENSVRIIFRLTPLVFILNTNSTNNTNSSLSNLKGASLKFKVQISNFKKNMGASLKIDFPFGRRTAFRSIREIRVLKIASPNYLPSVDDRWFVIPNSKFNIKKMDIQIFLFIFAALLIK